MSWSEHKRKRFERRIRDSHTRWSVLGKLALHRYQSHDGMQLLKAAQYDLYYCVEVKKMSLSTMYSPVFVHPRWIGK